MYVFGLYSESHNYSFIFRNNFINQFLDLIFRNRPSLHPSEKIYRDNTLGNDLMKWNFDPESVNLNF